MRKKLLYILILVLLSNSPLFAKNTLANEGKAGVYANSIERVLRLDDDQIDIATAVLLLSRQWDNDTLLWKYRNKIDQMSQDVIDQIGKNNKSLNSDAIEVINKYLFEELGFETVDNADDPQDLFVDTVLDNRRGYCLSLSVLYLSITERLGLPVYGVVVPGHFFVRYDDGNTRFNIETTSKGNRAPDKYYIEKFKVPLNDQGDAYLKNLSKKETLACFFNNLGNSYQQRGDYASAMKYLERSVQLNPGLTEAHTNLGNVYLSLDYIPQAVEEYQLAIKLNFSNAKAHNNLANAYRRLDRYALAISEYNISLRIDPDSIETYKNLSNLYLWQKNYSQALSLLEKAITKWPKEETFYITKGDVYKQSGRIDQAVITYQQALNINPDSGTARLGIGLCYLDKEMPREAIRYLKESLYYDTANASVYFSLGRAYNKISDIDSEIDSYLRAIKIKPNMIEAIQNVGNAYFRKQMYEKAADQYLAGLSITPDSNDLYYNLGSAYYNSESYEPAEKAYLKAIELAPDNGMFYKSLAFCYYYQQKYQKALDYAYKARSFGVEIEQKLIDNLIKLQ